MSRKTQDIGMAMLQPGRRSQANASEITPVAEIPMVLTLDEFGPNPDNPRTSRNPRYDEIKASIRARGLDTVPKVTRDPDGAPLYIFSDGGNTRYQILTELWQETGDERYYRIHVICKPWPGRLQCVIGHLAENEVRGELTFIEKAKGIHKARCIYEEQLGKTVSLRQLSDLLNGEGLPVHNSTISRMEDALAHLYPWIPDLLESGMGRPQITALLALRHDAQKVWDSYCLLSEGGKKCFIDVFGACCARFNSPDVWSLEMFRDEFIGDLLQALPHRELDYDRWMLELDPKERNRRHHFGEPEPVIPLPATSLPDPEPTVKSSATDPALNSIPDNAGGGQPGMPEEGASLAASPRSRTPRQEVQPDMYGGAPELSGDNASPSAPPSLYDGRDNLISLLTSEPDIITQEDSSGTPDEGGWQDTAALTPLSDGGDETGDDDLISLLTPEPEIITQTGTSGPADDGIWTIPPHLDDIEHLQNTAFRLAWELGEVLGCDDEIIPDRGSDRSGGYGSVGENCSATAAFLLGLTGRTPSVHPASGVYGLCELITGGTGEHETPVLGDSDALKLMRLMRVLRRLRELQRGVVLDEEKNDE
ncbi:chromosome partitioning protein ParB [Erwinia psidii]|uniref:ParB family protein n=1 Tax=Erwinia psidii TaxID=69224 RepID=UPI00226B70E8|nr:ParB family protein [Erwinia psidii]MCX8959064.1 chromosome partitioning protein ParB [Erwinia psidii]